jgi:hypothetical protein
VLLTRHILRAVLAPHAHTVHFLHDLLRPLHARRDELVRSGTALWAAEQIVGSLHVQAGEDRCHDPDHAFAALINAG